MWTPSNASGGGPQATGPGSGRRGPPEPRRLEHVSAAQGATGRIHREPPVECPVALQRPSSRVPRLRKAEGLEMLELLEREAIVDFRDLDLLGGPPDPREPVGHRRGVPRIARPRSLPCPDRRRLARPPDPPEP